jgi:excisionase family DNA binding protein
LAREPGNGPGERLARPANTVHRVSDRPFRGKEFSMETPEPEELLTPSEVAAMFRVNPKTVTRWARAGRISYIKTLGGHRRFKASEIRRLLEEAEESADT